MDKILTIVVPTYNMEKYLDKCLTSLIVGDEQMEQLEVLVINDGSKDRSSEIAHRYESRYPQTFRVIDKENGNYGSCVNCGLKEAKGKYIKILDADDSFDNHNFQDFINYLSYVSADCIISDMVEVNELDEVRRKYVYDLPIGQTFLLSGMGKSCQESLWMHSVCYLTRNIQYSGFHQTEGISYTDQEWLCVPMAMSEKLEYYPHIIYKYLVGRNGQTIAPDVWDKNFWQEIKGVHMMIEKCQFLSEKLSDMGKAYADVRIRYRISVIYRAFFKLFKTNNNESLMMELDAFLENYDPKMYEQLNRETTSRHLPFPYVKLWRKCPCPIKGVIRNANWYISAFIGNLSKVIK